VLYYIKLQPDFIILLSPVPIFDYIIVGSGPGGSTVAYRLTKEFPERKVLLIEAGGEPAIESVVSGVQGHASPGSCCLFVF
jgi:glycine/D-amino acid oxidase-like deaminating enzyme